MKVNDRVAVYGMLSPAEGGSVEMSNGKKGIIVGGDEKIGFEILMDKPVTKDRYVDGRMTDGIHPKQCRLLRKKRSVVRGFFYTVLVQLPGNAYRAMLSLLGRL